MSTAFVRAVDVQRKWLLIDADGLVLGRLAVVLANILRGKNKVCYSPNADCGDNIVVINAEKVWLTGKKAEEKFFYWHTGYPGGIKKRNMKDLLAEPLPDKVIHNAVKRMIPKGPLRSGILRKLKVYKGSEHPHEAQNPELLDLGMLNAKNKRRSKQ
ncbi:MAG: 50S ribosomal protein L13 [Holosporales bacterium]|jgi:large subunit ribosomal protein L13|nr:50S ribosomal protein L13 [Holosporales bacterium]